MTTITPATCNYSMRVRKPRINIHSFMINLPHFGVYTSLCFLYPAVDMSRPLIKENAGRPSLTTEHQLGIQFRLKIYNKLTSFQCDNFTRNSFELVLMSCKHLRLMEQKNPSSVVELALRYFLNPEF